MKEKKYYVTADNETVASGMGLATALLLIRALIEKYWAETDTVYAIAEDKE